MAQRNSIWYQLQIILLTAIILFSSCNHCKTDNTENQHCDQLFVGFKGELTVNTYQQIIERQLFKNKTSGLAVLQTKISRTTFNKKDLRATKKLIREFVSNDSIYSYDSSDSTYIVISTKNIDLADFDEVLLSSILLLQGNSELSDIKQLQTNRNLICNQTVTAKSILSYTIWTNNVIPLEIEKTKDGMSYHERAVNYICDTLIDPRIFIQPQGFRKIQASEIL